MRMEGRKRKVLGIVIPTIPEKNRAKSLRLVLREYSRQTHGFREVHVVVPIHLANGDLHPEDVMEEIRKERFPRWMKVHFLTVELERTQFRRDSNI